jgi:hypothetical protein
VTAGVPPDLLQLLAVRFRRFEFTCYRWEAGPASEAVLWSLTAFEAEDGPGREPRLVTAGGVDAAEAAMEALGIVPSKTCGTCHATKPLDQYSQHAAHEDGRCNSCKVCEAGRRRTYGKAARRVRQIANDAFAAVRKDEANLAEGGKA